MRRTAAVAIVIAGLTTAAGAQSAAPPLPAHEGRWFGVGGGVAHARLDCSRCGPLLTDDPWRGGTGFGVTAGIGITLRPRILLGAEISLYGKRNSSEQRDATVGALSAVMRYYAAANSGLYLQAGAGPGFSTLAGGPGLVESTGWALNAALGYDIAAGRRVAMTPYVRVVQLFAERGVGDNRGIPAQGPRNPRFVDVGLGFYWY